MDPEQAFPGLPMADFVTFSQQKAAPGLNAETLWCLHTAWTPLPSVC